MPPDLTDYVVTWWRPNHVTATSTADESGQRGIAIPGGYPYVGLGYAQCRLLGNFRQTYKNQWADELVRHISNNDATIGYTTPVPLQFGFEIPSSWMSGALIYSEEVETMDGIVGIAQNMTVSDISLNLGGLSSTVTGGHMPTASIDLPSYFQQPIYRIREGFNKLRPKFWVPQSYWWFTQMNILPQSERPDPGSEPVPTDMVRVLSSREISSWGNYGPFSSIVPLHIMGGVGVRPATDLVDVGRTELFYTTPYDLYLYEGQMAIDYLIEVRFYREAAKSE